MSFKTELKAFEETLRSAERQFARQADYARKEWTQLRHVESDQFLRELKAQNLPGWRRQNEADLADLLDAIERSLNKQLDLQDAWLGAQLETIGAWLGKEHKRMSGQARRKPDTFKAVSHICELLIKTCDDERGRMITLGESERRRQIALARETALRRNRLAAESAERARGIDELFRTEHAALKPHNAYARVNLASQLEAIEEDCGRQLEAGEDLRRQLLTMRLEYRLDATSRIQTVSRTKSAPRSTGQALLAEQRGLDSSLDWSLELLAAERRRLLTALDGESGRATRLATESVTHLNAFATERVNRLRGYRQMDVWQHAALGEQLERTAASADQQLEAAIEERSRQLEAVAEESGRRLKVVEEERSRLIESAAIQRMELHAQLHATSDGFQVKRRSLEESLKRDLESAKQERSQVIKLAEDERSRLLKAPAQELMAERRSSAGELSRLLALAKQEQAREAALDQSERLRRDKLAWDEGRRRKKLAVEIASWRLNTEGLDASQQEALGSQLEAAAEDLSDLLDQVDQGHSQALESVEQERIRRINSLEDERRQLLDLPEQEGGALIEALEERRDQLMQDADAARQRLRKLVVEERDRLVTVGDAELKRTIELAQADAERHREQAAANEKLPRSLKELNASQRKELGRQLEYAEEELDQRLAALEEKRRRQIRSAEMERLPLLNAPPSELDKRIESADRERRRRLKLAEDDRRRLLEAAEHERQRLIETAIESARAEHSQLHMIPESERSELLNLPEEQRLRRIQVYQEHPWKVRLESRMPVREGIMILMLMRRLIDKSDDIEPGRAARFREALDKAEQSVKHIEEQVDIIAGNESDRSLDILARGEATELDGIRQRIAQAQMEIENERDPYVKQRAEKRLGSLLDQEKSFETIATHSRRALARVESVVDRLGLTFSLMVQLRYTGGAGGQFARLSQDLEDDSRDLQDYITSIYETQESHQAGIDFVGSLDSLEEEAPTSP